MCTAGTYGFIMCATSEMPQATNTPSDSAAPATCARDSGASTPHTWLTLTPTFSNTSPRIRRDSPPPCRRCPGGLLQLFATKRPCGSSASKAAHTLPCRSRKPAVAVAAKSLAPLMDVIHQPRHRVGVRVRPDAVAQVEDVPGGIAGGIEYRIGMAPQRLGRGANSAAGSRLPCTALPGPSSARTWARSERQSTPITSTSRSATAG